MKKNESLKYLRSVLDEFKNMSQEEFDKLYEDALEKYPEVTGENFVDFQVITDPIILKRYAKYKNKFNLKDSMEFHMLMGYSVCGFCDVFADYENDGDIQIENPLWENKNNENKRNNKTKKK